MKLGLMEMPEGTYLGPKLNLRAFELAIKHTKVRQQVINIQGIETLGSIHTIEPTSNFTSVRLSGDRFMATVSTMQTPPVLQNLVEVPEGILGCNLVVYGLIYRAELEIRFINGKGPQVFKGDKQVLTIENMFCQEDDFDIYQANDCLYFKENGDTLVRVSFASIRDKIAKGEATVKADTLEKEVKAALAVDDRYYTITNRGELRNNNKIGLRIGANLYIDAACALVALEDRIVVVWYHSKDKRNVMVLVSRNLDYQSNLAYSAVGSRNQLNLVNQMRSASKFQMMGMDFMIIARKSFAIDIVGTHTSKLYLVKQNVDITTGVDSVIKGVWPTGREGEFIAHGHRWYKVLHIRVDRY